MKRYADQQSAAASAAYGAEASSACPSFPSVLVQLLDAVILASIFVLSVLVRISVLVLVLSLILVLCVQDRENRWKTQAAPAL